MAPDSKIRAAAEYDAGAALMHLEDWDGAIAVLDAFRETHPDHELREEATKQLAHLHREQGRVDVAAVEYERIAREADSDEVRREALQVAGELHAEAGARDRAVAAYRRYLELYPEPLELAVETHDRIAALHASDNDRDAHHAELRRIVELDHRAGAQRSDRIRFLAAKAALELTADTYDRFAKLSLTLPFERSLATKQARMREALDAFGALVDYEVAEVTAAATFYMAEIYRNFSASLIDSERPAQLSGRRAARVRRHARGGGLPVRGEGDRPSTRRTSS